MTLSALDQLKVTLIFYNGHKKLCSLDMIKNDFENVVATEPDNTTTAFKFIINECPEYIQEIFKLSIVEKTPAKIPEIIKLMINDQSRHVYAILMTIEECRPAYITTALEIIAKKTPEYLPMITLFIIKHQKIDFLEDLVLTAATIAPQYLAEESRIREWLEQKPKTCRLFFKIIARLWPRLISDGSIIRHIATQAPDTLPAMVEIIFYQAVDYLPETAQLLKTIKLKPAHRAGIEIWLGET